MCNADAGIISHHWIKESPDPFANFNTGHKCRDIGSAERWIEEHAILKWRKIGVSLGPRVIGYHQTHHRTNDLSMFVNGTRR